MRGRRQRQRALHRGARSRPGTCRHPCPRLRRGEILRRGAPSPATRQDRRFRRKVQYGKAMKLAKYLLILLTAFALVAAPPPPQKKASDTKSAAAKAPLID